MPLGFTTDRRRRLGTALFVGVDQQHIMAVEEPAEGELQGDRGLADSALGVPDRQYHPHMLAIYRIYSRTSDYLCFVNRPKIAPVQHLRLAQKFPLDPARWAVAEKEKPRGITPTGPHLDGVTGLSGCSLRRTQATDAIRKEGECESPS